MEILQAIVLGIIQGLTEFLPVSSTAHLILVPKFFEFSDPGLSFDVALHLGTLIAVVSYFYKDWIMIFKSVFENKTKSEKLKAKRYGKNMLWLLVIATIPGVLAGYFLEGKAETVFRSPLVVASALVIGGLILYLADVSHTFSRSIELRGKNLFLAFIPVVSREIFWKVRDKFLQHKKNINDLNLKDAVIVGLLQAVAIVPGVSRSGATIVGGLWRGLDREGAARFSFLLSTPVIFGAVVHQFSDFIDGGINLPVILGILSAAVSGFLAVKYMLKLIHRVGYGVFFWYRLVLAVAIVIWLV